jgi:two-component system response regulator MtrA
MRARVLVVDDDPALAEMLGIVLRSEGFAPSFVADGERALAAFRETRPDVVLLDLMLPGMSGIDVCRPSGPSPGVPIVMLTAKSDTVDVVLGSNPAPTTTWSSRSSPRNSWPRCAPACAAARTSPRDAQHRPPDNQISIDVPAHTVTRNGDEVKLTPLEFDLLVALARKPRQVFTREVLLSRLGLSALGRHPLVNVHVQRLRGQDRARSGAPEIILTVRGVGYKAGTS